MTSQRKLPESLFHYLTESPFRDAIGLLEIWITLHRLELVDATNVDMPNVPVCHLVVPVNGRVHPLLTLQPPPNHPDLPFHRIKAEEWSPYHALDARIQVLAALNAVVVPSERKPDLYADRFFRIPWLYFASAERFGLITGELDEMIARVRQGG